MLKNTLFWCLLLLPWLVLAQPTLKLKPIAKYHLDIPEPSDLCITQDGKGLFVVSDNGLLYKTDLNGQVVQKSTFTAYDLEGVYADSAYVYAVDERTRKVHFLNVASLTREKVVEVPYMASRNKGYESIGYNPVRKTFFLISEKDPTTIFELDASWRVQNEVELTKVSDVSAACFYNGLVYILSDEDHTILECDAHTYDVKRKFWLPIINPEGLAFDPAGNMYVVSDDRAILYHFGPLPAAQ